MIKNVEMTTIEAQRFSSSTEKLRNVRVDQNSTVTLITELNDKEANIKFRFTANYSGIGIIKIEGAMIHVGDAPKLVSDWSSNGQMPPEIANEVHNAVMSVCVPESVMLARDVKLPPPIPMPRINVQQKQNKSPAPMGPEVA